MKKIVAALAVASVLLTSGCASASGEKVALDECISLLKDRTPGESLDTSGLKAASMSDALFESGITDTRDTEKVLYTVVGDAIAKVSTTERRLTVICNVTLTAGEITSSSITAS